MTAGLKFPVYCQIVLLLLANVAVIAPLTQHQPFTSGAEVDARGKRSYDVNAVAVAGSKGRPLGNSVKPGVPLGRSAVFATENSTVVVAQIGGTATLPCVVRKFSSGVVSWIRKQDSPALLTVGLTTYSSDDRFIVEHARHLQNWGLLIKHVQPSDAGLYECQVSTHPPTSIFIKLKVTEASAEILGAPDLHIRAGSLLRLVCTLRQSTETPSYMFWFHEQRMINYDTGIQVMQDKSSSVLLLHEAEKMHEGNYTCKPSNAVPAWINVHVLNATEEETPAAMLHSNKAVPTRESLFGLSAGVLFAVIFPVARGR